MYRASIKGLSQITRIKPESSVSGRVRSTVCGQAMLQTTTLCHQIQTRRKCCLNCETFGVISDLLTAECIPLFRSSTNQKYKKEMNYSRLKIFDMQNSAMAFLATGMKKHCNYSIIMPNSHRTKYPVLVYISLQHSNPKSANF